MNQYEEDSEKVELWCEFLDEMAGWLASQDTNEDAQFWANSHNADVLREIRVFLSDYI